jgi:hypothetical protein
LPDLPIFSPNPPDFVPPPAPPEGPPDFASPGYFCSIPIEGRRRVGFVQTAINTSSDHKPKPPEQGLPGEWITARDAGGLLVYVWLATVEETVEPTSKTAKV